ncbi:unnamed protein product [Aphanomyces euteiches]|uniref:Uncharacterized protein n=1 Tax=Aphanomyces euteiches TaxID=100861 RepID=A0A6G0XID8_9STRA|nr:hypothetical protein Ae201684_004349 [Aphanomyces euteiches]KAH9094344.1 hypothetical protein Ae201684P_016953 [Aphanomyces euteiches]KAH9136275.1 hypothetical protein AeRB84_018496 [Aphanomyces euteiches]
MAPLSCLSRTSLVLFLGVIPLLMILAMPSNFVLLAVLYVPPCVFAACVYRYRQRKHEQVDVDMLVRLFVGGLLPGIALAWLIELILAFLGGVIFFAMDTDHILSQIRDARHHNTTTADALAHLHIHNSFNIVFGLLFMSFLVAGSVEEYVKYWVVKGKSCIGSGLCVPDLTTHGVDPLFTIFCFASAGCGFATMENVCYTFVNPQLAVKIETAILRGVIATPFHMICTSITAMRLLSTMQNAPHIASVLAPAILLHGTFDFQAFIFALWFPSATVMAFCASLLCMVIGGLYLNYLRCQINWNYQVLEDADDKVALQIV